MSKKILILESSVTIQKVFTTTLDGDDYTLQFISDSKLAIPQLFESVPDLFLLNADFDNPGSFEIVRLVRSMPCFKELAIGMYATQHSPFDDVFALSSGVTSFVLIDQKTMTLNIDELAQISAPRLDRVSISQTKKALLDGDGLFLQATGLLKTDSMRNAILKSLFSMMGNLENIEDVVRKFLLLITEFCEVPIAGMYVVENDGPHAYYVCAENMGEHELSDFLNVCSADFEKELPDYNASKVSGKCLERKAELNRFFSQNVQLSSYESAALKAPGEMEALGSVHIVAEGNFTNAKIEAFSFCVKNGGLLFQKTVMLKKKLFFEKRIRRAFSRFVPEQIIDDLVASADTDEKVGVGETRAVAILFSDIRSFTNISERNKPEVLVAFLNRYFTMMVDAIKKHGGTIDKFIGDAIMALFGAPVSYEDNARRAVAAACEMRRILPEVPLGDLVMPEGMTFNIGIGIHYGDVTVGSLGSADKTDYTCIGDSVNLASRLEGLTKTYGTQVLVSESVRLDAGVDSFCFRHLDDVRVKGKAKAVPIYAVDRSEDEFPTAYKDAYKKGMELYKDGIWNLAKDYFEKALVAVPEDKAAKLMLSRCQDFIANPPAEWDGAIAFNTK